MSGDGKEYEKFVKNIHEALLRSEDLFHQKTINVEQNVRLKDRHGVLREFDLYWEYELAGITYKTVIECKDYNKKVSIDKIDAVIGKVADFQDLKVLFATTKGYQSGAEIKAKKNKIELLVVRPHNDTDWVDEEGNPCINKVHISGTMYPAARITSFEPAFDGKWVKENTDIDVGESLNVQAENDKIIIEDAHNKEEYSLLDFSNSLSGKYQNQPGEHQDDKKYEDAYLRVNGLRLKMLGFRYRFTIGEPITIPIEIDMTNELLGVVEYLNRKSKTAVYKDFVIKNW